MKPAQLIRYRAHVLNLFSISDIPLQPIYTAWSIFLSPLHCSTCSPAVLQLHYHWEQSLHIFFFSSSNYPYLTTEISKFKSATPGTLNSIPIPNSSDFCQISTLSFLFPSFPWFTLYPLVSLWLITHPPRRLSSYSLCFSPSWSSVNHHPYHPSKWINQFSSLSRVRLFGTPWIAARQASLSITNSQSSFRLTSIESVMPSSHLILCHPLLLLPPIPPSITVFSNESTLRMRWPKYWSFSSSTFSSKEIPGLISFRMDWLDLLVVQGTLKSLLQHHNSKASILRHSAFFIVQHLHPYMATGKNHSFD